MRRALHMAMLIALAGCASVPAARLYTLDMTPSGQVNPTCNISLDRLRVHEALNRHEILIMKSPTEIEYYATDKWAASLPELIGEKLRAEFGNPVEDRPTILISGKVLAFGQVDTDEGETADVKLEMMYHTLEMDPYDPPLLVKTYAATVPVTEPGINGVVLALSDGLESIAAEVARDADDLAQAQ